MDVFYPEKLENQIFFSMLVYGLCGKKADFHLNIKMQSFYSVVFVLTRFDFSVLQLEEDRSQVGSRMAGREVALT